jgi:hypothetical protein
VAPSLHFSTTAGHGFVVTRGERLMAVKVEFKPVGRTGHEWIWKARDDSNTISISGQRFDSLGDAVRDARIQIDGLDRVDDSDDDGPFAA